MWLLACSTIAQRVLSQVCLRASLGAEEFEPVLNLVPVQVSELAKLEQQL